MRRLLATTVLLVVLATTAAAASSGNGVAGKKPLAIVAATNSALAGVHSVHVKGSLLSGGTHISLDLTLLAGVGGTGTLTEGPLSFRLITVGKAVYISGADSFWARYGGSAAVTLFHGRWLKAPASTSGIASVSNLTNLHSFFAALLGSHGRLAKGSTSTLNGKRVIAVTDTSTRATLYVATTGAAYPIEFARTGAESGKIVFDRFNASVKITAPKGAIDISKLHG